jgi:hypothetical protein
LCIPYIHDHSRTTLLKFLISVRERVWGLFFEFEGTSGGPCQELIFDESLTVIAACALLLLFFEEAELWLRLMLHSTKAGKER